MEILNGGGLINFEEREDAERSFIRHFNQRSETDRPKVYEELVMKHGRLDPLVNINLKPEQKVQMTFTYLDRSVLKYVDVHR